MIELKTCMAIDFNPRSREGSDLRVPAAYHLHDNFNPRSREGSDDALGVASFLLGLISIHAPAKGATSELPPLFGNILISIHAPAKGATRGGWSSDGVLKISIHAPAKGATPV